MKTWMTASLVAVGFLAGTLRAQEQGYDVGNPFNLSLNYTVVNTPYTSVLPWVGTYTYTTIAGTFPHSQTSQTDAPDNKAGLWTYWRVYKRVRIIAVKNDGVSWVVKNKGQYEAGPGGWKFQNGQIVADPMRFSFSFARQPNTHYKVVAEVWYGGGYFSIASFMKKVKSIAYWF